MVVPSGLILVASGVFVCVFPGLKDHWDLPSRSCSPNSVIILYISLLTNRFVIRGLFYVILILLPIYFVGMLSIPIFWVTSFRITLGPFRVSNFSSVVIFLSLLLFGLVLGI